MCPPVQVVVAVLAAVAAAAPYRCRALGYGGVIGDSLADIIDAKTSGNRTAADDRIPGYMYELYRDTAGSRQYDVIRSIPPKTGIKPPPNTYV